MENNIVKTHKKNMTSGDSLIITFYLRQPVHRESHQPWYVKTLPIP